ncbi:hypothetical protein LCALC10_2670 [Lacticaseibacillus paracasei]|uniref:hypothetical protein n=1 Tax=Lacticaseibacillus paracasei TaxID=1597 RepID=UPI000297CEE4|nr:hypothetical protein [Lacticaseibacillus paracasei]EKQ25021.1 hypothetical protein LCALC10_2670 [Lacticaseibacillus paracasei]MEA1056704.1 hypothetical protein [Lacticaseibacillus paracasei]
MDIKGWSWDLKIATDKVIEHGGTATLLNFKLEHFRIVKRVIAHVGTLKEDLPDWFKIPVLLK